MENQGFVSNVKSFFGAFVSENTNNALSQKMQAPVKLEVAVSADQSRISCCEVARVTPPTGDSFNEKLLPSPASRFVIQPSCSLFKQKHKKIMCH